MSIPPTILGLLRGVPLPPPGVLADGYRCEGSKFHSPQPLIVTEYDLGEDESVMLCGTCTGNLTVLMSLLEAHKGSLPWEARREFGNMIRALGLRAYALSEEKASA